MSSNNGIDEAGKPFYSPESEYEKGEDMGEREMTILLPMDMEHYLRLGILYGDEIVKKVTDAAMQTKPREIAGNTLVNIIEILVIEKEKLRRELKTVEKEVNEMINELDSKSIDFEPDFEVGQEDDGEAD